MLFALSLIVIGNGFFKPNISTIVGSLYKQGDRRRDAGFTIFYMGINVGSIGSQILCPIFANWFGWWAGFAIVVVGMLIGYALMQFDGGRLAGYGEPPKRTGPDRAPLIYILSIALRAAVLADLPQRDEYAGGGGWKRPVGLHRRDAFPRQGAFHDLPGGGDRHSHLVVARRNEGRSSR